MEQIASTPLLRQVRRTLIPTQNQAVQPAEGRNQKDLRWHLLDLVKGCRQRLKLRDRDVAVLRGLLSLMPKEAAPHQMVVFASNRVLTERCDGIDERTLRRRIAHLQEMGLLSRKSSPNGKRYQVRDDQCEARLTYGIDLSPMFLIQSHLEALCDDQNRESIRIAALKAMIRDALYHFPDVLPSTLHTEARLSLRRAASGDQLSEILNQIQDALLQVPHHSPNNSAVPAVISSGSDGQNDRHIHRLKKETYDSESLEAAPGNVESGPADRQSAMKQDITVEECMELATTAKSMCPTTPRCWEDVISLSATLAPAIGLKRSSVEVAAEQLGRHGCALAILGLVEAFGRIRSPEAYLRTLTNNAQRKAMDFVRMFRSLVRRQVVPRQFA